MKPNLPTRKLREHPDLNQLKRQAKELLEANGGALHDAQLELARSYGFVSWPKLKAYVDGATIHRLVELIRAGDLPQARAMLKARPELVDMDADGLQPLHHAVLSRAPEMVRLLMECGADARVGIYPHRDATGALTIAIERGYSEIVAIIERTQPSQRCQHSAPAQNGMLTTAVIDDRPDVLACLLDQGLDPDERTRVEGSDDVTFSWGAPLWHCAGSGKHEMAAMLLSMGADPNGRVYASGSPMFQAYAEGDEAMIELLARHGGVPEATSAGLFRQAELARKMLAGEAKYLLDGVGGDTLAEQLLWAAAGGGDAEIVRMALDRVDWGRDDARWFAVLEQPLRIWAHGSVSENWGRGTYLTCFGVLLERCDANIRGRFGLTILHSVAGSRRHLTAEERTAFAAMLLDAGARLDVRDDVLLSTPLGWACRWGRVELVKLFLKRGADPQERDAEPWATPKAWAEKMGHRAVLRELL